MSLAHPATPRSPTLAARHRRVHLLMTAMAVAFVLLLALVRRQHTLLASDEGQRLESLLDADFSSAAAADSTANPATEGGGGIQAGSSTQQGDAASSWWWLWQHRLADQERRVHEWREQQRSIVYAETKADEVSAVAAVSAGDARRGSGGASSAGSSSRAARAGISGGGFSATDADPDAGGDGNAADQASLLALSRAAAAELAESEQQGAAVQEGGVAALREELGSALLEPAIGDLNTA